jgi:hypothetical protein
MDKYAVNITIPDGYTVEQVPEPLYLSKMGCNFKYSSSVSGNTIQFMVINQLNAPIVPASYYATLKNITKN